MDKNKKGKFKYTIAEMKALRPKEVAPLKNYESIPPELWRKPNFTEAEEQIGARQCWEEYRTSVALMMMGQQEEAPE